MAARIRSAGPRIRSRIAATLKTSFESWVSLSTWRFALGAALAWAWLLLVPGRRAALATIDRRGIAIAVGLGVLYTGNSGTYYAGIETVFLSPGGRLVFVVNTEGRSTHANSDPSSCL